MRARSGWLGLLGALCVLALPLQTRAQDSPLGPLPPGWTVAITDVIALFSPAESSGSVTIIAPPALATTGDLKAAFIDEVPALIEDLLGESRPTGAPTPLPASDAVAPGLAVQMIVVMEDGGEARLEATGYRVRGGRMQLFLLAAPTGMADDDPQVRAARTLVDQWRAAGLVVTPELSAQIAASAAAGGPNAEAEAKATSPAANVENVIHYLRFTFDGTGAAAEPTAVTALLMKDGRVYEGEPSAPADFNPTARPPGSAGTGRWQRDGEAYALAFADGTQGTAVAAAAKTQPAPAALTLAGTYLAAGGPASEALPDRLSFFPDGSLLLAGNDSARSGTYAISERTIRLEETGQAPRAFLFGLRGNLESPELLVVGNRIYERAEEPKAPAP